jgi:hypothetical protein
VTDTDEPPSAARQRVPRWQVTVTGLLVIWLGAQAIAGWKFANGETYPVVGSAMFNSPPIPGSDDFLVPRVFGVTAFGQQLEMDQHTFGLEPFEWRRWIKRNLEDVSAEEAAAAAADLAAAYDGETGRQLSGLEVWRIPALSDDFERGRLVRSIEL